MTDILDQEIIEAEGVYLDFLDNENKYINRIKKVVDTEQRRLIIDINDLRRHNEDRANKLLKNSFVELCALQNALKRCVSNVDPQYATKYDEFFVGIEGSFGGHQLNPRTLTSAYLGEMVCIEGIVTKTSLVRSKVLKSVHYCPATKKFLERKYNDASSVDPYPSSGAYPTKDDAGNILETEYGLSKYKDSQSIVMQEMPENAPAGQMPRSLEVILENDLVDICKAGDRVYVTGQYRCLPGKRGGYTTARFRSVLICNNVTQINRKINEHYDNSKFKDLRREAKNRNILDTLVRSIAPSICGLEFVKKAILCQLLGGVERTLTNGTRIRGDINVLLLGDPSVAKSQFLRYVLQCSGGRAIATTGRGSTGVGLTAAVTSDKETGEKTLEAGAMVLADRGLVCIDEFDKMNDIDRTAIHEVMEQGRVTIAKAGIQAKLNARCSVLAAANPVYGRYDQYKTPMENIGLQDSLLSRFDLVFILLDQCDEDVDRTIGEFVMKMHCYRNPGESDGHALPLQELNIVNYVGTDSDDRNTTKIREDSEKQLYGVKRASGGYFTKAFLEQYIQVARTMEPKLTLQASNILAQKYCDIRNQEAEIAENSRGIHKYRTQPVTVRTLETLIRLATAFAKAHLRAEVLPVDAESAGDLVSYVMFKEVLKKKRRRDRPRSDSEGSSGPDDNDNNQSKRQRVEEETPTNTESQPLTDTPYDEETLTRCLSQAFDNYHDSSMLITEAITRVRLINGQFSDAQIRRCLKKLHDDNKLMITDDEVYML